MNDDVKSNAPKDVGKGVCVHQSAGRQEGKLGGREGKAKQIYRQAVPTNGNCAGTLL